MEPMEVLADVVEVERDDGGSCCCCCNIPDAAVDVVVDPVVVI